MKVKAYAIIFLVVAGLIFLAAYPAYSGVAKPTVTQTIINRTTQTVTDTNTVTVDSYTADNITRNYENNYSNLTHRVLAGTARGGGSRWNVWTRFNNASGHYWSRVYGYPADFTREEKDWLKTIYAPGSPTNQYFDLTTQTWRQITEHGGHDGSVHNFQTDLHRAYPDYSETTSTTESGNVYQNTTFNGSTENTEMTGSAVTNSEITGSETFYEVGEDGFTIIETTILDILDTLTEYFTTTVTNSYTRNYVNTITNNVTNHTYQIIGYFCESPLVLDLDDNKRIDTARNIWMPHTPMFFGKYARFFDITGDGGVELCEWIAPAPKDALLVMPENGKVEGALQCFGTAGGYADGYEKLSLVCDKDNNGVVEGEELAGLKLWFDENNDAICQNSEMKELSDYHITKLSTSHKNYVSSYVTSDGAVHTMWDWWPTVAETRKYRN